MLITGKNYYNDAKFSIRNFTYSKKEPTFQEIDVDSCAFTSNLFSLRQIVKRLIISAICLANLLLA